jgi:site-specific DNA-methyltransferase (adenine-specific)
MGERLANDLIASWSRPLDVVLDPLAGAATTCKMALLTHRYYLGFEVHGPYHEIALRRMADAHQTYRSQVLATLAG